MLVFEVLVYLLLELMYLRRHFLHVHLRFLSFALDRSDQARTEVVQLDHLVFHILDEVFGHLLQTLELFFDSTWLFEQTLVGDKRDVGMLVGLVKMLGASGRLFDRLIHLFQYAGRPFARIIVVR